MNDADGSGRRYNGGLLLLPPALHCCRFFSLMKRALSDSNYFRTIGEVTSLYPAGIWKLLRSTGAVEKFPVSV
jgi:hypothetical protein